MDGVTGKKKTKGDEWGKRELKSCTRKTEKHMGVSYRGYQEEIQGSQLNRKADNKKMEEKIE